MRLVLALDDGLTLGEVGGEEKVLLWLRCDKEDEDCILLIFKKESDQTRFVFAFKIVCTYGEDFFCCLVLKLYNPWLWLWPTES